MNYTNNLVSTEDDGNYVDVEKKTSASDIKRKRLIKLCILFGAVFLLSMIVGVVVSAFMGSSDGVMSSGGILIGLGIGAAVGVAIAVLPLIVCIVTTVRRKDE